MAIALKELLDRNTAAAAPELVRHEEAGAVRCLACGHRCHIAPGASGVCRVRFNQEGVLRVPAGYVASLQVDPIEKKPFFHAFPGREALSFGMLGCDLHCAYCQNWITSQTLRDEAAVAYPNYVDGARLVDIALQNGAPVVVSTYNEPLITSEWAVEIFRLARARGLVCGYVSNGNGTPEVLDYLRPHADLFKVDLKGFRDRPYRQLGGLLQNVLDTIVMLVDRSFWVEVVTLVVPGFNDSDEELRDIARFLAGVSPFLPWHVTAFHPDYRMDEVPPTPAATLRRAYDIGRAEGLYFVYPGNLPGRVGNLESTFCPGCERPLVERTGFTVRGNALEAGCCPDCGFRVPGVWGDGILHPLPRPGADDADSNESAPGGNPGTGFSST
jgi:pyruvate formate lyase activating enzyme